MSLSSVEEALAAVLRTSDYFNDQNCTVDDPTPLGTGQDVVCIIRYAGDAPFLAGDNNEWGFVWTLNCDLWFRQQGLFARYNTLVSLLVQDLYSTVLAYPTLNDPTIWQVKPMGQGAPDQYTGELQNWWTVGIPFQISERQVITVLE